MNDLVRLAMERAVQKFGNEGDGIFNGAGFGLAFYGLLGLRGGMDGIVVRGLMVGRPDVEPLSGGHYRLLVSL